MKLIKLYTVTFQVDITVDLNRTRPLFINGVQIEVYFADVGLANRVSFKLFYADVGCQNATLKDLVSVGSSS